MPKFELTKPDNQILGDGFIVWQWSAGSAVVEAIYAAREGVVGNLDAGGYIVSMKLPEMTTEGDPVYVFGEDAAETLGSVILSAVRWETVWTHHAGEYLRDLLSQEPPAVDDSADDAATDDKDVDTVDNSVAVNDDVKAVAM